MLSSIPNWLSSKAVALSVIGALCVAGCEESSSDGGGYPADTPPGAATNVVITEGDRRIVFTFDDPTTGDDANRFTASCSATDQETIEAFSAKSPLTLTGFVNDVTYTCTLIAANNAGEGPDAGPFDVTPNSGFDTTDCSLQTTIGDNMTCLSHNYLDGLTTTQRAASILALTESNATGFWSPLPAGVSGRVGLPLSSMDDGSKEDALALIESMLSAQGFTREEAIRVADDFLGETSTTYDSERYFISFLGVPTYDEPWIMLFTGNHYTFFASVEGEEISLTPNFAGVEPTSFTFDETDYSPLDDRQTALAALLASLSDAEQTTANLGETFTDILLGPGDDGDYPETQEGLAGSDLSAAQRALLVTAIEAFAGDHAGGELAAEYTTDAALDDTYIAWSTDAALVDEGAYVRIDGPNVWLEFVVVAGEATSDTHYHSIWRDKTLDYGGNFDLTD